MKHKIIKSFMILSLCILILGLFVQNVKALPIEEIGIPMVGATYNSGTGNFRISGASDVTVFNVGGTEDVYNAYFLLNTGSFVPAISSTGYTAAYGGGEIELLDADNSYSAILSGDLQSLELEIKDSRLGLFEGEGEFLVTAGSRQSDFGNQGGVATVGISFKVPFDFYNSFTAMTNTKLFPITEGSSDEEPSSSIPEPSIILLLGSLIIGLGLLERRKMHKK